MIATALREGSHFFEWEHTRFNGEKFPATVLITKLEIGNRIFIEATVRDITGQKRNEEALHRANRQLTLLSGITRHDILNQIFILRACLDLSKKVPGDAEKIKEYIEKEAKAVNAIERQILFTREYENLGGSAPVWQNAAACISKAVHGLDLHGITVEGTGMENVEIYADLLLQNVFFNLIDNALRHGDRALGRIQFSTQESGKGLVLTCEDDGCGIPASEKERVFERGFGKNTGFGLFFVRDILAVTGISVKEIGEPGRGARFEMTVPAGGYRFISTKKE
jgi:signal transduction histidine kinase